MDNSARYLAFLALRQMDRKQAYANIALDRVLSKSKVADSDRHLATELVYGITRHQRTLDALIEQFSRRKSAAQQPPDLRRLLHLGFYQLHYLDRIPPSAAVNTTVELARRCKLGGLTKVVNGILRSYLRTPVEELLPPHPDPIIDLARRHSYPEWLLELWLDELGASETETLCHWFNQPPAIDLRVNTHRSSLEVVQSLLAEQDIVALPIEDVPGALRLQQTVGSITELPGYSDGLWMVQDCSAQQVALLLDPQPGETIVDCCAAPGGKTTHIAELMGDRGTVWGLDKHAGRLRRVKANAKRLQLTCIRTEAVDLTAHDPEAVAEDSELPQPESCDRVLVDAPCSGLGTLHRHADARWRQQLDTIDNLLDTQADILDRAAQWVKPGGVMVYSTCTIFAPENQEQVERFLETHSNWQFDPDRKPQQNWPHRDGRDGFYMARLQKLSTGKA
ncbi:MAG: 16S rRNA (cytosine(967)-C(5))-methyltransferase [Synechococcus sp.]